MTIAVDLAGALLNALEPPSLFDGQPMKEPRVLYRSVSLGELFDIARRGVICGGGNLFNTFDPRPDVFFADEIDDVLVGHGEHVPRQVTFAMREHLSSRRIEILRDVITRRADFILRQLDDDRIAYDRYSADDFRLGLLVSKFRGLSFRTKRGNGRVYARHFRALRRLLRRQVSLSAMYDRAWHSLHQRTEEQLRCLPFSSAILVTRPITGGRVYSTEAGFCGHGEREYGFRLGQVTLADVAEVVLLKDRREVARGRPQVVLPLFCSIYRRDPGSDYMHVTSPDWQGAPALGGAAGAGGGDPRASSSNERLQPIRKIFALGIKHHHLVSVTAGNECSQTMRGRVNLLPVQIVLDEQQVKKLPATRLFSCTSADQEALDISMRESSNFLDYLRRNWRNATPDT